jgi:hypothetical protein
MPEGDGFGSLLVSGDIAQLGNEVYSHAVGPTGCVRFTVYCDEGSNEHTPPVSDPYTSPILIDIPSFELKHERRSSRYNRR